MRHPFNCIHCGKTHNPGDQLTDCPVHRSWARDTNLPAAASRNMPQAPRLDLRAENVQLKAENDRLRAELGELRADILRGDVGDPQ